MIVHAVVGDSNSNPSIPSTQQPSKYDDVKDTSDGTQENTVAFSGEASSTSFMDLDDSEENLHNVPAVRKNKHMLGSGMESPM